MGKNILVFSDGTGLRGGIFFGEKRSNVYKLYRATYSGPNSRINPAEQLVFYDPGVGSIPRGWASAFGRWCYNFIGKFGNPPCPSSVLPSNPGGTLSVQHARPTRGIRTSM